MRGREEMYGYLVAAVLAAAAVANLVITHGTGAPAHPPTGLSVIGLLGAVVLAATVRVRNRLLTPFLAVIVAFFVTLPKVPRSLDGLHIVALVVPVIYALWVTQRHKKAQGPRPARGRRGAGTGAGGRTSASSAGGSTSARTPVKTGKPSGRYTPPKSRRR